MPFSGSAVEYRVGYGQLLSAPLPEVDDEGIEVVLILEEYVRLDGFELVMEHEQWDSDAITRDVLDVLIVHEWVDRTVSDKIPRDVICDLVLRDGLYPHASGLEVALHALLEVCLLVHYRELLPFVVERLLQSLLDQLEEFLLVLFEGRLDDL